MKNYLLSIRSFIDKHKLLFSLLLLFGCGLAAVSWFRGDFLISATDLFFPTKRTDFFKLTFSSWDSRAYGSNNFRMLAYSFPYGFFLWLSDYLQLSLSLTQKIWFYILHVSSGVSMLFLALTTYRLLKKTYNYTLALIAALFFMFNPFFALLLITAPYVWQSYAFLPLKLSLFMIGIVERKSYKYVFFTMLAWIITTTNQYVNPKYFIFDWVPLLLFLFCYLIFIADNHKDRVKSVVFTISLFSSLLLFYSYWLLPALQGIRQGFKDVEAAYTVLGQRGRLNTFTLDSGKSVLEGMRLWGNWALDGWYKGEPYFFWTRLYGKATYILLGYVMTIIICVPLVLSKIKPKIISFFVFFLCISIVGMSGGSRGFDFLNLFLAKNIPLFTEVYSIPYTFFGIYAALAYSILFAYGISLIYERIRNRFVKSGFILCALVIFIGAYSLPLWTGDVMRPQKSIIASNRYAIPDYYFTSAQYMSKKKLDFKVFALPYSQSGYGVFAWKFGFNGPDVSNQLLGNILQGINSVGALANQALIDDTFTNKDYVLSLLNARYVLLHADTNWVFLNGHPWWKLTSENTFKAILNSQKNITLIKKYGKLFFYKIKDNRFLPHIYTANEVTVQKDTSYLSKIVTNTGYDLKTAFYFTDQNNAINMLKLYDLVKNKDINKQTIALPDSPQVEFKKISPSKYRIVAHRVRDDFLLIFSETFNTAWKASVNENHAAMPTSFMLNQLSSYKVLDGNGEDQANKSELINYIRSGYISTLGDNSLKTINHTKWTNLHEISDYIEKHAIDFVSKNFQGSIQNDNLSGGSFYESFFYRYHIPELNHLKVNGYANSWIVDTKAICSKQELCKKNTDGSYEIEILLYFWPQHLYYIGIAISAVTFIVAAFFALRKKTNARSS